MFSSDEDEDFMSREGTLSGDPGELGGSSFDDDDLYDESSSTSTTVAPPPPPASSSNIFSKSSQYINSSFYSAVSNTTSATLHATGSVLKSAGSATTTYVLAPTASVLVKDLLPEVGKIVYEYIQAMTPQRSRDVARIFGSGGKSLYNLISVTPRGQKYIGHNKIAFNALIDAFSSPFGRQMVVDCAASYVKCAEASATPESKAALDSGVVSICRIVDFFASEQAKEFYHSWADAMWEGVKLSADGATTVAAAEVVANICHALVMEAEVYKKEDRKRMSKADRARGRVRRGRHVRLRDNSRTMVDGVPLETAILKAFGDGDLVVEENEGEEGEVREGEEAGIVTPTTPKKRLTSGAQPGQSFTLPADGDADAGESDAPGTTTSSVRSALAPKNSAPVLDYLPSSLPQPEPYGTPTKSGCYYPPKQPQDDDEDTGKDKVKRPDYDINNFEYKLSERKANLHKQAKLLRKNGKKKPTFMNQFEKMMQSKNKTAVERQLGKPWFEMAAAAAGAGNENGQDSIKRGGGSKEYIGVGNVIKAGNPNSTYTPPQTAWEEAVDRYSVYVGLAALSIAAGICMWVLLGFYGVYVMLFKGFGGLGGGETVYIVKYLNESGGVIGGLVNEGGCLGR